MKKRLRKAAVLLAKGYTRHVDTPTPCLACAMEGAGGGPGDLYDACDTVGISVFEMCFSSSQSEKVLGLLFVAEALP